jgi:hypothetical protein
VWFADKDVIVAMRDIAKGEELFYDYALSESNDFIQLDCLCGAAQCRGTSPLQHTRTRTCTIHYTTHAHSTHTRVMLNVQCAPGRVTGKDYRRPELQARYGRHFMPYILAKIERERAAAASSPASSSS